MLVGPLFLGFRCRCWGWRLQAKVPVIFLTLFVIRRTSSVIRLISSVIRLRANDQ